MKLPNDIPEVIEEVQRVFEDKTIDHHAKRGKVMYLMGVLESIYERDIKRGES